MGLSIRAKDSGLAARQTPPETTSIRPARVLYPHTRQKWMRQPKNNVGNGSINEDVSDLTILMLLLLLLAASLLLLSSSSLDPPASTCRRFQCFKSATLFATRMFVTKGDWIELESDQVPVLDDLH
jgi:hypothetical protein